MCTLHNNSSMEKMNKYVVMLDICCTLASKLYFGPTMEKHREVETKHIPAENWELIKMNKNKLWICFPEVFQLFYLTLFSFLLFFQHLSWCEHTCVSQTQDFRISINPLAYNVKTIFSISLSRCLSHTQSWSSQEVMASGHAYCVTQFGTERKRVQLDWVGCHHSTL